MPIRCAALNLTYLPIPKVACTSLKCLFYEVNNGAPFIDPGRRRARFAPDDVHTLSGYATTPFRLRRAGPGPFLTVVRDPLARFLSAYRNRFFDFGDLTGHRRARLKAEAAGLSPTPDLDAFLMRYDDYMAVNATLRHHFQPMSDFVGPSLDRLDHVFDMADLKAMEAFLSDLAGRPLTTPRFNEAKSDARPDMTLGPAGRDRLAAVLAADYALMAGRCAPLDLDRVGAER